MVEGLKEELTALEPVLEQASKDAETLLKQVEIDKVDAAKVKEKVREDRAVAECTGCHVSLTFANLLSRHFTEYADNIEGVILSSGGG